VPRPSSAATAAGQPPGGVPVAGVRALPQFLDATLLGEQPGQAGGRVRFAGVPVVNVKGVLVEGNGFRGVAASFRVFGKSISVDGVVVVDQRLPHTGGQRNGASCTQGVLVQVIGHGVARYLANRSAERGDGGTGAE
jgi:hypothetical protein